MLTILVETQGSTDKNLQFGSPTSDSTIVAMFNPNRLTVSRSVSWPNQNAAKRDTPESQFIGGEPATLSVDLFFDTYDTDEEQSQKKSVKKLYTDKLLHLTTVEQHGKIHRPPVCRLTWGEQAMFFQGVLQQIETQFTMFVENGLPVRATNRCTFKQWVSTMTDLEKQNLMSSDVAKVWIVKRGQTLASIAAEEYGDPRQWQAIADANGIDNPLALSPGMCLMLPVRQVAWSGGTAL
ncbi:CIS tube protein [Variovorax sp. GT1P44]|uniref:CIS tube protein n=1 Tax=Variovorax sp. GT1P44 TaxID=3443742 RepID=UPI003F47B19E